jgi:hypothetical protein
MSYQTEQYIYLSYSSRILYYIWYFLWKYIQNSGLEVTLFGLIGSPFGASNTLPATVMTIFVVSLSLSRQIPG